MSQVSARRGTVYVSVAAVAWGTGGAAGALLFQSGGLGPAGVSLWRYLLGGAILLLVSARTAFSGGSGRVTRAGWRQTVVVGVAMAVYQTAYFAAIARSGVAIATVVTMGATPVLTALGGRFLLGERLGGVGRFSLLAALGGLVLLSAESVAGGSRDLAGVGFALLSALGYGGVTLYSRHRHGDPEGIAIGGFAVGALCLVPFALQDGVLPQVSLTSVGLLLYLGAVPTALAYGLFFRALTALKATTVSIISLGEAVAAALLGVVLFGEHLTALAWSGCVLLMAAVVVLTVHGQR
ncbi:DMT family transporter [Nonomuraea sp. NBC_01738]|uniref:DMT family transporter n=1 Tax=Nonomuraea sp. NBC_01738 TaxID=2976003 RepID=UPI002E165CD5|nr:DMT family transporter [Nonomuraea sp. NBC_01738]